MEMLGWLSNSLSAGIASNKKIIRSMSRNLPLQNQPILSFWITWKVRLSSLMYLSIRKICMRFCMISPLR